MGYLIAYVSISLDQRLFICLACTAVILVSAFSLCSILCLQYKQKPI